MTSFDEPTLALRVLYTAGANDPESSRVGREGFDPGTVRGLAQLIAGGPEVHGWLGALVRPDLTEDHVAAAIGYFSAGPPGMASVAPPDVTGWVRRIGTGQHDGGALPAAFAGLLALALLEGLARGARPAFDYPYLSLRAVEEIVLPVADLLTAAGFLAAAAELATCTRSYILLDDYQRGSEDGQRLMARCRRVERAHTAARRVASQETAWLLRERAEADASTRSALATVLFASGDPVRAFALGRREHLPSVAVLTDLVEMNLQITATDELLRAVWLEFVLRPHRDLPERVALPFRMRRRDVNSAFKGELAGFTAVAGMDLGEAYAKMLFGFVTGVWKDPGYEPEAWNTILRAMEVPVAWNLDPGSFIRILDLFNLALEPAAQLPVAEHIYAFTGRNPAGDTDIRPLISASLSLDAHTGRRGRLGRSLTYDSAFLVEPWRRGEPVATSVDALEQHRAAGLDHWSTVVPPFTPTATGRRERAVVQQDSDLVSEYRSLITLTQLGEGALHHRIYGDATHRRTLRVDEGERVQSLNDWGERRSAWFGKAVRDFPSYAALRHQGAWTVSDVQRYLRSGIPV